MRKVGETELNTVGTAVNDVIRKSIDASRKSKFRVMRLDTLLRHSFTLLQL